MFDIYLFYNEVVLKDRRRMVMKIIKKAALSCMVLLMLLLSPVVISPVAAYAEEVSAEEHSSEPKLNVTELSLVTDDNFTLKVFNVTEGQKVSFKSSDTDIVEVDKTGRVTAKKVGEAIITVSIDGDKTYKCKVIVGPPAISVKLTLSNLTLKVGSRKTLQTIIKPNTSTESPVFSSTDSDVVAVTASGKVVAKSVGKAYIISEIGNGKYDMCLVTVVDAE